MEGFNPEILTGLVKIKMPFGKYKGTLICNIPVVYLEWFKRKGFPKGKLGQLLETMYEIKINGLDYLLTPLKNQ
ncbi:MAG: DUF3820 family protein [Ferruginibacter sp.]